jgi:RND family efflux transporter MFP subunit
MYIGKLAKRNFSVKQFIMIFVVLLFMVLLTVKYLMAKGMIDSNIFGRGPVVYNKVSGKKVVLQKTLTPENTSSNNKTSNNLDSNTVENNKKNEDNNSDNVLEVKQSNKETEQKSIPVKNKIAVKTYKIKTMEFRISENSIGVVNALNRVLLSFEMPGKINVINFEEGDYVNKGDVLAEIDSSDIDAQIKSQEAEINKINASLKNQQIVVDRYATLLENGYVSQSVFDNADTELAVLMQNLESAKAVLDNLNIKKDKYKIVTSITGLVQSRNYSVGDVVDYNKVVFDVVDNSKLMIVASFPEYLLPVLNSGLQAIVSFTSSDLLLETKIKEIKPVINDETRNVEALIEVKNGEDYNLKVGSTVRVEVTIDNIENAILVPNSAVVLRNVGHVVYIVDKTVNKVKQIKVTVGQSKNGMIHIIKGVSEGDLIVSEGAGFLTNGAEVNIIND